MPIEDTLDEPLCIVRVANVARHPAGLAALTHAGADLSGRLLEHLRAPAGDGHARSAACQLERGGLAETGPPAGHQCDPPAQQVPREYRRTGASVAHCTRS